MSSLIQVKKDREERYKLAQEMKTLNAKAADEGRDFTAEEAAEWDRLDADVERLGRKIERDERLHDYDRHFDGRALDNDSGEDRSGSRDGEDAASSQHASDASFYRWLVGGPTPQGVRALTDGKSINVRLRRPAHELAGVPDEVRALVNAEMRAQSVGTDSAGGYTVPQGFSDSLEQALLQFGGMRQSRATLIRTATGNRIEWPTVNDTGNAGALLAENGADSEQDVTFGQKLLDAYKYTSKIVRVSVELEQDSAFSVASMLGSLLGERLGRIFNTHATTGTGSSQPNGIVTASAAGVTAASSSTIADTELVDLEHSVDPAYRGDAEYMFADATLKILKKLKDGDSRLLWVPGLAVREPDTILGYRYVVNQDVPTIEASAKSVIFGDLSKYVMRDVLDITLTRLVELYAANHQIGYVAIMRFDGELMDAGTNPVKHLVHPSP